MTVGGWTFEMSEDCDIQVEGEPVDPDGRRRVRFACIDGLTRADLPLACEVWRDDLFRAPWADRETMKLAIQLTRYICDPDPAALSLREVERQCHMSRDDVIKTLRSMRNYGAAISYFVDRAEFRVLLELTLLQRLRVLEAKRRFRVLQIWE